MPLPRIPGVPKLTEGLLDRLRDKATNRIKQELAPKILPSDTRVPAPEALPQSFTERLKQKVKERLEGIKPVRDWLLDRGGKLDEPTIKYRIRYAGQRNLLLFMRYNDQWRHVEPYSYRFEKVKGSNAPRLYFYGYCRPHERIHKFRLERFQGLIVTDEVFVPRWPVEVA